MRVTPQGGKCLTRLPLNTPLTTDTWTTATRTIAT